MTTRITNRLTGIAGAIVLAVLLGGLLFAGTANAQSYGHGGSSGMHGMGHGMMGYGMGATTSITDTAPYAYPGMHGMMGGMGHGMMGYDMGYGMGTTTSITDTTPYAYPGSGWCMHGMMGYGMGHGMMGATTPVTNTAAYGYDYGGWGHGMMGSGRSFIAPTNGLVTPLSLDQATQAAEASIAAYGNPDLALAEILEFTNNFYVLVREQSSGSDTFELLVDRYTGAVFPEPGPNMMWNTKYGYMGGMMGNWWSATPSLEMPITPEKARSLAQAYLDQSAPGTLVDDEVDTFYGYYTIETLQDGQMIGMLSVNGYTGQIWIHTWHGAFVAGADHD